jgi:AAA+ ATPase superfamily predicted ATPase
MRLKNTKLFLILCGSSMSFMENQVLGYQSPLYGRRTAQFKIQPFSFFESVRFHQNYDAYDSAVVYGITGGIPQYLARIDGSKTIRDNIIGNFFEPSSYLYEEPSNLLKQELREPQTYNEIITAIATGSSRLNEVSTKTGLDTAVCSKYLISLIALGIVKKERPVFDEKSKRTIYRLEDNMFRFWYRFVPQNAAQINSGAGERVYESIERHISHYMGEVFEEISKQYMWKENIAERLPFYFRDAGRWWGTNPIKKSEQEIDIIAYDETQAIFCECKWSNEPVGNSVLESLIEKSMMFNYRDKYYFLFSKSGYTDECAKTAGKNIKLIDFKDMI